MRETPVGTVRGRKRFGGILLAAALGFVLGACSESNPEAERAARQASEPWLALLDGGEYEKCWETAAPWFRETVASLEMWLAKALETREPLGAMKSRHLAGTTFQTNPMGAPDGEYTIVVYSSSWEAGNINEMVSMQRQADGSWGVVGYHVKQR